MTKTKVYIERGYVMRTRSVKVLNLWDIGRINKKM